MSIFFYNGTYTFLKFTVKECWLSPPPSDFLPITPKSIAISKQINPVSGLAFIWASVYAFPSAWLSLHKLFRSILSWSFCSSVQFSSVSQLCPTLCDPFCSTPLLICEALHIWVTYFYDYSIPDLSTALKPDLNCLKIRGQIQLVFPFPELIILLDIS